MNRYFLSLCVLCFFVMLAGRAHACESCSIAKIGREGAAAKTENNGKKWFFEYLFENQVWKDIPANEAHSLHHAGHHVHDKTTEQLYHYKIGKHVTDNFTFSAELPYAVRNSIEIHSHGRLGAEETATGTGDLKLVGQYRFLKKDAGTLGVIAGIKLPTGETDARDSVNGKFEPESQPGSGSVDYLSGLAYQKGFDRVNVSGNAIYLCKTEGEQDYEFGDVFSTAWAVDYLLNPKAKNAKTRLGLETNFQYEMKHVDSGGKVADSGGKKFLWGPALNVEINEHVSFSTLFLSPVYQEPNGVHQNLDYVWTLGSRVVW